MEDKFKKLVSENRDEFEIHDSDADAIWKGIDIEMGKVHKLYWWKMAAAILLLMVVSLSVYSGYQSSLLPGEIIEAENYYSSHMTEKLQYIKSHNVEIDPIVFEDLEVLDKEYETLKKDLKDDVDNEEVIQAMMEMHRVKLTMLEQILNEIQDNESDTDNEISI